MISVYTETVEYTDEVTAPATLSAAARGDFLKREKQPLFRADWLDVVFIHYEVDAVLLQREVPYELDLHHGRAWVSLVAFAMRGMKFWNVNRLSRRFTEPIGTHGFLNVRTYVRAGSMRGIYFLREFLPNRISVLLGPMVFGLPYRWARLDYMHDANDEVLRGVVDPADGTQLRYQGSTDAGEALRPAAPGSRDEFLLERYVAFTLHPFARTHKNGRVGRRATMFFRVWHPPWPQRAAKIEIDNDSLLREEFAWMPSAKLSGGHYSPGVQDVWMGRPHM
jgi:uncharacterized protein YqjF (DUF2071 family)